MHLRFALASGLLLLLLLLSATGCAYRTPVAHLPPAIAGIAPGALDVSDVTVVDARGPIDEATVARVQRDTAAILVRAAKERVGPAAAAARWCMRTSRSRSARTTSTTPCARTASR